MKNRHDHKKENGTENGYAHACKLAVALHAHARRGSVGRAALVALSRIRYLS